MNTKAFMETAAPSAVGISEQSLLDFLSQLEKAKLPMHAVLLMRHGKLVAEGYYAPFHKGDLHRMFSICKTLNALAVGILEADGVLSLDDPIAKYFPEKVPQSAHPFITSMTIRNLLMMRTCHASTTYKIDPALEWVESFFTTQPSHKPGTVFHYDTSAAHVLCMLVQRLAGKPMLDFLKDRVLRRIGWSEDSYVLPNNFGDPQGGSGLMCTPMDLLLLGKLLLQHGEWEGEQLLPRDFTDTAVSNLTPTAMTGPVNSEMLGYGYQIWRSEYNGFVCYGMGGQLVICLPDYDLVCVTCADTQGMAGGNQFIYNSFYNTVLAAIQSEEGNTSAAPDKAITDALHDKLQSRFAQLRIMPVIAQTALSFPASEIASVKNTLLPAASAADKIQGATYIFSENSFGFTSCCLDLSDKEGVFHYEYQGHACSLHFGLQECSAESFPVYGFRCASSGAWIAPDTFYIKCHLIDTSVGSVSMELVFGEDDITVFLKKIEETMLSEYNGHLYGKKEKLRLL